MTTPPRVLISYSHDSDAHRDRVLALTQELRREGIDAWIDQFEPAPGQGWPQWMRDQVRRSDFVVLVCTPTYRRRFEGEETPGVGRGVAWESMLLDQLQYEQRLTHETLVPVYFEGVVDEIVPLTLRSGTIHALSGGIEALVKRLTRTLAVPAAPLGGVVQPVRPRSAEDAAQALKAEQLDERRTTRRGHAFAFNDLVKGRYRLYEHVESGGFAEVWKGVDEKQARVVAVKVLHGQWSNDQSRIERFTSGAAKMATLRHDAIVAVLGEVQEDRGRHFYAMPWYAGGDLRTALLAGRLTREQALEAVASAIEGLMVAHGQGMVHRDVKPQNILIDEAGKGAISDFDLALAKGSTQGTRTGMGLGSILYAAPEALTDAGQVDVRADVYGAGLCAVFVLTGRDPPPFVGLARPELIERLDCGVRLRSAIRGAVAYEREQRTTTCAGLVSAIRAFVRNVHNPVVELGDSAWPGDSGVDEYGKWATLRVGAVEQKMRWVPPGSFTMGSPPTEAGRRDNEGPQHEVTFTRGYWLADTPCTQALWVAVMDNNPSRFMESARLPVERLSWNDIQEFMSRLNAGVPGLDAALPTEARWEYACRAMTSEARYGEPGNVAWYSANAEERTHEVGGKSANAWGLHDMLGNVWEWCAGTLGSYEVGALVDPGPRTGGPMRVSRGGSWGSTARGIRAACRGNYVPGGRHDVYLGFRLALGQGLGQEEEGEP